jgi:hypothetical protein
MHAARGGDHDDIGIFAAGDMYEALEDAAIVFLILGAADRYNPTAFFALGNLARHQAQRLLSASFEGVAAPPDPASDTSTHIMTGRVPVVASAVAYHALSA